MLTANQHSSPPQPGLAMNCYHLPIPNGLFR
jgi:hypothetical protein